MERTGGGVLNSGADSSLVVWSLLIFCLLSGPATGDQHAHCSEFLCLSPPSLLVRLLSFSSEQGPCGSPLDLPSGQGLGPGPVAWSPLSPTVVIVPGRRPARLQPSWARVMAGELLEAGLVNVLVADWLLPPEQEITEGARQVGERLAQAIQTLLEDQGSSPELFHLVGFGVGAHVAGVAGACLEGAIGRITGLDPFSPLFSEADSSLSLDHTDAQYVDVIHTNFNPNEPVAPLGVPRPLGHVDFYIGRGYQLPGCPQALMKREHYLLCSHQRAYRLFTSSIRSSCPLTAFPCQGVEDFQRALCTHCHHPGLNICPQLGYDISWLPPDRPITFQPLTAVLDITATDPFCGQELRTHTDSVTRLQLLPLVQEQLL
uniref:Phospholipase A1 member A n=1 Tax=Hucho hucho TaxID=62062 RepID=A0A4W5KE15_9TELE